MALDDTTDDHRNFADVTAFKLSTFFLATAECAPQTMALHEALASMGTLCTTNADITFNKVLIMVLRLLLQLPRLSPAEGVLQRVFMQLPLLLRPRVGGAGVGEASTEATSKACIKHCANFRNGRIKKIYSDTVKNGAKLRGPTTSLYGGPLRGPALGAEGSADARVPGTSLANYLLHLESTQEPNIPAEFSEMELTHRLIRGAGATDGNGWPHA
ncbi:hypothetical protein T484DRAFT_1755900 [Baffinella frigidus]|nr:hypothetical protein T484DRAFT_1755900 [Cryptophyta sp. CCMP2293]